MLRHALLAVALVGCAASSAEDDSAVGGSEALSNEEFRTYAAMAAEAGAPVTEGTVTVVGLRGLSAAGVHHDTTYHHAYDDTFVVLKADGTVVKLAGSTHPFENDAPGVPDIDHDGKRDVGMIRPGIYDVSARDRLVDGQASFAVNRNGSGALPGWRDTNHDGILTEAERAAAEARRDAVTDVLFHDAEGSAPPAVGCQVFSPATMKQLVTAVGGAHAHFRYVLIDAPTADPEPAEPAAPVASPDAGADAR